MKFSSAALTALVLALLVSTSADAALIAGWDFNNTDNLNANSGIQLGTAGLTTTGSIPSLLGIGEGNDVLRMPGTVLSSRSITLVLSGTGLSGFQLSYDAYSEPVLESIPIIGGITETPTTYNQSWSWSTGEGFDWEDIIQPEQITSAGFNNYTVDFSSISDLNNASTIYLRNSFSSGTGIQFDNLSVNAVNAVPEPSGVAAMFLGVVLIGFFAKKQLTVRRQAAAECNAA